MLRERLGAHATFLGWLEGDELAPRLRERRRVPVRQPDRHLRPGAARGAGQRAAGRRGRRGRPAGAHRRRRDRPAVRRRRRARWPRGRGLAASPLRRERLAAAARAAVAERTWERALQRLADGYGAPLLAAMPSRRRAAAAGAAARAACSCASSARASCASSTSRCSTASARGGIRTYLDAKRAVLAARPRRRPPRDRPRTARAPRRRVACAAVAARGGGQRLPRADRRRRAEARRCGPCPPDVVLLHDPFWSVWASTWSPARAARASSPCTTSPATWTRRAARRRRGPGAAAARVDAPRLPRGRRGDGRRRPVGRHRAGGHAARCASASTTRSGPGRRSRAATTCCTSVAWRARRASTCCSTRPRAAASRGRWSSSAAVPASRAWPARAPPGPRRARAASGPTSPRPRGWRVATARRAAS